MCAKSSDNAFQEIIKRVKDAQSFLILTHARPDGDGLGSMVALGEAARRAGKTAHMLLSDPMPERYEFLFTDRQPISGDRFTEVADRADAIMILDTCAFSQLGDLGEPVRGRREKVIVIDHHATCDDVGALQWIDTTAAAVGVMIGELLDALGWEATGAVADALATAILTDTGWLRFSNTDSRSLQMITKLVDAGVRLDEFHRRIYQRESPQRLALMVRMLGTLELHCDEKLAVMSIRKEDFSLTGAKPSETEDLINEAMRLRDVEAVVLLVEQEDCTRASLRSRGAIDVARIAQGFGGGGHAPAAGAHQAIPLDEFKKQLIDACSAALSAAK